MKQLMTVFRFEFVEYVRRKSFLGVTIALVLLMAVGLSLPRFGNLFGSGGGGGGEPGTPSRVALLDETGKFADALKNAVPGYELTADQRSAGELQAAVDSGEVEAAVVLHTPLQYTYIVKTNSMYDTFQNQFDTALKTVYQTSVLGEQGMTPEAAQTLLAAQPEGEVQLTSSGKDQTSNFFYTYILIFALYFAVLMYGQFVATSVATEKSTRAMELLVTSTKPRNLMFGKVLGVGCAGLLQFGLIVCTASLFYQLNASYYADNFLVQSIFGMPPATLGYCLLFFLLGYFIYAFLYAAVSSLVSRMEELSTAITPVMLMFVATFVLVMMPMNTGAVDTLLMKVLSFIPFTSPMAMFVRITMGSVAPWEIIVSVVILLVSTVLVGALAASIYRMGVLLYGKVPKPGEIVKMLKANKAN